MNMFRFAAATTSPSTALAARNCSQCLRPFSSPRLLHRSSRRTLQTATAHRPSTLSPPPPPPRNAGIPSTSIAADAAPQQQPPPPETISQQQQQQQQHQPSSASIPEAEAQTARPATPAAKPRRSGSKLRARKAAMTLTSKAVLQLRGLLDQPEPKLIRVGVKNRGCSGLAYQLEYVDKAGAFDETVEQDGVKVLIDSKALFSIIGSEMDWIEDKLNERFIFRNPNISEFFFFLCLSLWDFWGLFADASFLAEQCGCGESFSIS